MLLATDLDRTLLPNGKEKTSMKGYTIFKKEIRTKKMLLSYVTGRRLSQVKQAIVKYNIPYPDFIISMVGTQIHIVNKRKKTFTIYDEWNKELEKEWKKGTTEIITKELKTYKEIWPQGKQANSAFKQSYYANPSVNKDRIEKEVSKRLQKKNISFSFIYSIDTARNIAQIDILPKSASKYKAILFLAKHFRIKKTDIITAGDTGNDFSMLLSGCKSILVGNATESVKKEFNSLAKKKKYLSRTYVAKAFYVNGILEGLEKHLS